KRTSCGPTTCRRRRTSPSRSPTVAWWTWWRRWVSTGYRSWSYPAMGTGTPDDPIRVLLVDDDEEDFILTRHYLREIPERGYHLEWVSDYDKALDLICTHQHDVYLVDLQLGERDGLTLLREAQERGCGGPIILLTGQGQFETDM